jgi:hypothetical protein
MPRSGIASAKYTAQRPWVSTAATRHAGCRPVARRGRRTLRQRESCKIPRFDRTDAQFAPEFNLDAETCDCQFAGSVCSSARKLRGFHEVDLCRRCEFVCAPHEEARQASRGCVPRPIPERPLSANAGSKAPTPNRQMRDTKTAKREKAITRQSVAAPAPAAAVDGPIRYYRGAEVYSLRRHLDAFFCEKDADAARSGTQAKS